MANHIGEIVTIADLYTRSTANDHICVQRFLRPVKNTYAAYARSQFNSGHGPKPFPILSNLSNDDEFLKLDFPGEKPRGWGKVDIVCEDVPLEKALELAEAEAKKRNCVLYLEGLGLKIEIKWHPEGWLPFSR